MDFIKKNGLYIALAGVAIFLLMTNQGKLIVEKFKGLIGL